MSIESLIRMLACMTAPSGRFSWDINSPSNAAEMNSINRAAPWANKYGVMAWNPSGIGFVGIWLCLLIRAAALHRPNEKEISHGRVSWQTRWGYFVMGTLASSIG